MNRPTTKRLLGVLAYVVSALCLFWVFRGIDFHNFAHQFEVLQPGYLCVAIGFSTAVYFVNSLRWFLLLRPLGKAGYWRTLQAVYLALFSNEVLPLRPGELIRCYLLSRWSKLPLSNLFASLAVERVLEGVCMMAGFFAVAFGIRLPPSLLTGATILAGCIVALAGAWMIHAKRPRSQSTAARPLARFLHALATMGNPRVAVQALGVSCVSLSCLILAMWFLMKGGRIDLSLAQAAAVFLIIRVGTVLPSAPGNIGSYQFFCVLAMGLFGVEKSAAAAFSLLIYSAFTVPLLIGGGVAFAMSGLKFHALLTAAEQ
jgi:uncharacterized protein (TIRG00374 family)